MNNKAIVLVIEGNSNYMGDFSKRPRYYEEECVRCIECFKKFNSDVDIYVFCVTNNKPSNQTIDFIKKNGQYIEEYCEETELYDCGFFNKIVACKLFEEKYNRNYDIIIHIDLDMYQIRPLNFSKFKTGCLIYDEEQRIEERYINKNIIPFNTCFIISREKDFFSRWWCVARDLILNKEKYMQELKIKNLNYNKLEELSMDLFSQQTRIERFNDIMFGETYTTIEKLNIHNLYFHHYHIKSNYNFVKDILFLKKQNVL